MSAPVGLIFLGSAGSSSAERLVHGAQEAAGVDVAGLLRAAGVERLMLVTDAEQRDPRFAALGVEVEVGGGEFHFGRRLVELIARHQLEKVVYFGAGSAPLADAGSVQSLVERVTGAEGPLVVANNIHSADFCAFTHAQRVPTLDPLPEVDNNLAWRLREEGFTAEELRRSTATLFDIDTPTDVLVLSLHQGAGPAVAEFLARQTLDLHRLEQAMTTIISRDTQMVVCGRISSHVWAYLETETACGVRVLAEERGMKASGRDVRGEAVSLLGLLMEARGFDRAFADLGRLGQVAFVDSRVLFAHFKCWPSDAERFASDLLDWQAIENPLAREFTRAAAETSTSVILGGHSLVSGGLMALVEAAWLRHDAEVSGSEFPSPARRERG